MQSSAQDFDTTQLRDMLNWIVLHYPPGDYRIECRDVPTATGVRNRLNRIRAAEHADMIKILKENKQVVDERGHATEFDRMVFRIREKTVLISLSGRSVRGGYEEFIALNGPPPCGEEAALQGIAKPYEAPEPEAPVPDRFEAAQAAPTPGKSVEQRDAEMRDAQLI